MITWIAITAAVLLHIPTWIAIAKLIRKTREAERNVWLAGRGLV
jgi:hypothetical protein